MSWKRYSAGLALLAVAACGGEPDETVITFPGSLDGNHWWEGQLYALPWFVDGGILYWRTALMDGPPSTFSELVATVRRAREAEVPHGLVRTRSRVSRRAARGVRPTVAGRGIGRRGTTRRGKG